MFAKSMQFTTSCTEKPESNCVVQWNTCHINALFEILNVIDCDVIPDTNHNDYYSTDITCHTS
jgi:hypothetical protein